MELLQLLRERRSIRKYTDGELGGETLQRILQAGLLAPSGRGIYPVELILVRDKNTLLRLSESRAFGAASMLRNAGATVAVIADTAKSDTWIEDGAIAMTLMQLEATEQGIGSCWVQCRGRQTPGGTSTEECIRQLLHIPEDYGVLAMLSLGLPAEAPGVRKLPETECERVHSERMRRKNV